MRLSIDKGEYKKLPNAYKDCVCFCHTDKYKTVAQFKLEAHWSNEMCRVWKEKYYEVKQELDSWKEVNLVKLYREALRKTM